MNDAVASRKSESDEPAEGNFIRYVPVVIQGFDLVPAMEGSFVRFNSPPRDTTSACSCAGSRSSARKQASRPTR